MMPALSALPARRSEVGVLLREKRGDGFAVRNAADGFGEQECNRQLTDLGAGLAVDVERGRVGCSRFVNLRSADPLDRRRREHRMGAVGEVFLRAALV